MDVILCGEWKKSRAVPKNRLDLNGLEILEAEGDSSGSGPTTLLKDYENCSMAVGLRALKGQGQRPLSLRAVQARW